MTQWSQQDLLDLKNKRLLIIVESPNKVKTISSILKNAGYSKAVVMASVGHISNIKDTRGSYKNTGIYPAEDFRMNLVVSDDKKQVVQKLKDQADAAEIVFLMTDPDREGSQIAWSLIKFLKLNKSKYFRAVTHEITESAVLYAITHPIALEDNLIEAAQARMILDKMVGYALSPVARTYIGARSVGRCQSAGLKLIVDREREINAFVPEQYFDLYLNFTKNNKPFSAKYVGTDAQPINHLSSLGEVNAVKYKCNSNYIIQDITTRNKKEAPKPPFCTATFQQEVNNKLGLGVKEAMSCAQKLFEGININGAHVGLITYHRTDSTSIAPEFLPALQKYITVNLQNTFVAPRQGKKSGTEQDGHECLRCVNPEFTPEELAKHTTNNLLVKVYKLIWQRTIASAMPDAIFAETSYNIYNNDQKFILTAQEQVEAGYRSIYQFSDTATNKPVSETFCLQEILQDCSLEAVAKQTQPPARYKEATFIKELQAQGIGRPSTFAGILETVLSSSRGYCTLVDKQIVPTERGIQLSNFLDRAFSSIININYTKEMEQSLDAIAEGNLQKSGFLNTFYSELETAITQNKETGPAVQNTKTCPNCGAPMVVRRSRFGKLFYGCSSYPNCKGIINMS